MSVKFASVKYYVYLVTIEDNGMQLNAVGDLEHGIIYLKK